MTTAVMEREFEGHSAPPKIVLTLNCPETQGYLQPDNLVLEALYGSAIQRASGRIKPPLVYPGLAGNHEMLLMFLQREPDLSLREVKERLQGSWPLEIAREMILSQMRRKLIGGAYPEWVALVIINDELLGPKSKVYELLSIFPNASFFSVNNTPKAVPRPIWQVPLCDTCMVRMRRSWPLYICEGCGSTKNP